MGCPRRWKNICLTHPQRSPDADAMSISNAASHSPRGINWGCLNDVNIYGQWNIILLRSVFPSAGQYYCYFCYQFPSNWIAVDMKCPTGWWFPWKWMERKHLPISHSLLHCNASSAWPRKVDWGDWDCWEADKLSTCRSPPLSCPWKPVPWWQVSGDTFIPQALGPTEKPGSSTVNNPDGAHCFPSHIYIHTSLDHDIQHPSILRPGSNRDHFNL